MLKESSIEIIKSIYKEEEAVRYIEGRCIEFVDRLKEVLTEEDTDESKSLLIDVSLSMLRDSISKEENETIKNQMENAYNSLYRVSMNELISSN